MLTARDEEHHILRGFSLGADDYVTKPFSFAQLAARIKAVLSRKGGSKGEERLEAGDLQVDIPTKRVIKGGEIINLTPTEFNLLVTLMRHQGEVLSSEEIAKKVWGAQYANEVSFVRRYIWHLRKKSNLIPTDPNIFTTNAVTAIVLNSPHHRIWGYPCRHQLNKNSGR